MRRKIELYIDGNLADLSDQGLILMNYAVTEMEKPTTVKNSYSQQVTLPGTPVNDTIFSHYYRADKNVGVTGFNPLVRTPFKLFLDTGELLQSGYIKLDRVERSHTTHSYVITLYGGLGSLMYGLTYNSAGEKLSLADLTYSVADGSFYFTITKEVIGKAWERLYDGSNEALWDIINFAPCYNGLPATINADKARIQGDYDTVVGLSRKYTETETRDLRCQLQRPALRVKEVLDAIVTKASALGKTLVLDADFFKNTNPYYEDAWMLMPMLTEYKDSYAGQVGDPSAVTAEVNGQVYCLLNTGSPIHMTGNTFNTDASGKMDFSGFDLSYFLKGRVNIGINATGFLQGYLSYRSTLDDKIYGTLIGVVAHVVKEGSVIQSSRAVVFGNWDDATDTRLQDVLSALGATEYDAGGNGIITPGHFYFPNIPILSSSNVKIELDIVAASTDANMGDSDFRLYQLDNQDGTLYDITTMSIRVTGGQFTLQSPSAIGTGITFTKKMLLSGLGTPADFLLSYCRQFNLRIVETSPDVIEILSLNNFYNGNTIDLTKRVDLKDTKILPLSFSKKWQHLALDMPATNKAKGYADANGKEFGEIDLDTGMDFNAEREELLDGSILKGGVFGRWASPLLFEFQDNGVYVCPALVAGFDNNGTKIYPTVSSRTPLNNDYPGYDITGKVFGFDTENGGDAKAVEIAGTLVFFQGVLRNPGNWWVTDDYAETDNCWQIPSQEDAISRKVVNLPEFSRYTVDGSGNVILSQDFGTPAEVFDPALTLDTSSSIYTRFWEAFARDRYNKSTKVLTAKVDLSGLQVGAELMRYFFFYENSLWVLSKITNYSLTTFDPVECEFVQVQDMTNYLNGQIF